jgi:hypothetical protein
MAVALARTRGFTIDETITRERVDATIRAWAPQRELLFQGVAAADGLAGVGEVATAGYSMLELAAANVPPNATTDAVVHYISLKQLGDGRFRTIVIMRPPMEYSDFTATALAVRALKAYAPPGIKKEMVGQVDGARKWLLSTVPRATEEKTFQLQGLAWADADREEIAKRVATLMYEQRPDGGWAQFPTLPSDAYATGQVLVALQQAGGVWKTSAVYRNGIRFLLKTQLDDGSWHVKSRARGTLPYFETGFPHGADQFISAAGSAWATAALVLSLEPVKGCELKGATGRDAH